MAGTPVRVLLARHGETVSNVEGRWQGQTDSPLTERGLAQARELARALANEPLAAIYTSDLGRAFNTAQEVARLQHLEVTKEPRLRELDVGRWTGRLGAEIRESEPDLIALWRERPADLQIPGGETLAQAQQRALAVIDESLPRHQGQTVVIITHGALTQCLLVAGMGRPLADLWLKERIQNCQISRLEWTAETGLKLVELADVRHLSEVGSLTVWRVADARYAPAVPKEATD
jgi:2,3-bisphosphoglycerate-dependent phosphoglycerate mutase